MHEGSLSVTVLGSSGTYAGPDGACSGYLLQSGDTSVVMDLGPGTLANLQRHLDPTTLSGVMLSHSHPDHWLDLPTMRNALRYVLHSEGIPLYLTAETLQMAERIVSSGLAPTFDAHVIEDRSKFTIGDMSVSCSRTDHPVETLAFRVDAAGRSLGYSADTGPGWSIESLGTPPLDLVICEATFLDGGPETSPVHLSARQAGELARAAGAQRLLLSHVLPTGSAEAAVAEAERAYGSHVEAAVTNRCYRV